MNFRAVAPMLRSLLAERFHLAYHEEERLATAYSLIAARPKLKKADPDARIFCKRIPAPPDAPPGSQALTCQNATMALFADQLLGMYPDLNWPVLDRTGMEGGWNLTFTFNSLPAALLSAQGRGPDAGPRDGTPTASDPGGGYTFFEEIEKQLGLKLKAEKRPERVTVIDRLEQKPTDN